MISMKKKVLALAIITVVGAGFYMSIPKEQVNTIEQQPEKSARPVAETKEVTPAPKVKEVISQEPQIVKQDPPKQVTQDVPKEEPKSDNPYSPGSPMHYIYEKRKSVGKPIGLWGSSASLASVARSQGIVVDSIPQSGDIAVIGSSAYFVHTVSDKVYMSDGNLSLEITPDKYTHYRFIH